MKHPRYVLAGILIALLGAIPAQAQFRIDDTGQTFTSLQAALDAVVSDQTISIQAGTFTEPGLGLFAKCGITIKSRSGNQDVTLSGGSTSGAFSAFVSPHLRIQNIKFRNSDAAGAVSIGPPRFGRGGGVYLFNCLDVVFTNCEFSNNHAQTGGGFYAVNSEVDLFNTICTTNSAVDHAGGLYFDNTPVFVASGLTLNFNSAGGNGGGLWCGGGTYFCMRGTGFIQVNNAVASGGGMYCTGASTIEIADMPMITSNTAPSGSQGFIAGASDQVFFEENSFYYQPGWLGSDHYPTVLDAGHIPITRITYPGYPTPASVLIIPNRSGPCLSTAYAQGGGQIDATIKVFGLTYPQTKNNIWLSFTGTPPPTMFFWPNHPFLYPDDDVDPYGRAQFQKPIAGGGYSGSPNQVYVSSLIDDWIHNVDLDIYFNSPDITGNGFVDLSDFILFTQDYLGAGPYQYRSDFNFDGVVNLFDLITFTQNFCAFFIFPVTPVTCSTCQ